MASCGVAASSRATSGPATSSRTACSTWSSAFSSGSATCREGTITDEQVQNLLYNQQARAALFEVTGGDPDSVDENTVPEVIARLEERIRTPLREEVQLERDEAQRLALANEQKQGELTALRGEVDRLRADLTQERTDRQNAECDRAHRHRAIAASASRYWWSPSGPRSS